jgi:hypothetical protein
MSDTPLFKPEKDYTKEADKILPEATALAKVIVSVFSQRRVSDDYIERCPKGH